MIPTLALPQGPLHEQGASHQTPGREVVGEVVNKHWEDNTLQEAIPVSLVKSFMSNYLHVCRKGGFNFLLETEFRK